MIDRAKLREFGTSLASLLFVVVGLSGVLMFFHLFESYVKEMHEVLGVVFFFAVIAHIVANFKGLQTYFGRWIYKVFAVLVVAISLGFIFSEDGTPSIKKVTYLKVVNEPIENTFLLYGNFDEVKTSLEASGIKVDGAKTIKEIATLNKINTKEVLFTLVKINSN
jgi:hypothetical protein